MKTASNIFVALIAIFAVVMLAVGAYNLFYREAYQKGYDACAKEYKEKYSNPVERIVIDTLYITRDSLIYKTKYLTKIQHDTIVKIYYLDTDSSVELFYQLVSE